MSLQTAELYEDNEQFEEAFSEYKKLYEKNPNDLNILERLGHLAMVVNEKDEAAEFYSKILELDATNTLAYEQLMDIYVSKDKYKYYVCRGNLHQVEHQLEHAINDYKKAVANAEDEKQTASARFVLASLYEQTDNEIKAMDEYLKVIDYEDIPEEVYLKLANLYVKQDFLTSAVELLERAQSHGYNSQKIKENLAKLYLKNGQADKALELTNDEMLKIKCLLENDQKDEAFAQLSNLNEALKRTAPYFSLLAQYNYLCGNYDEALKNVDDYSKLEPNSPLTYQMKALIYESSSDNYNYHLNWGKYNLVRGDKDIAINEYLNAYQYNDKDINLMTSLAVLLEESGDKNHAVEFYEKIAEAEPANRKALEKLAQFREDIGDYRMQCDYLEKIYDIDKRNLNLILKLAETYERIKNKPAAVEFYNKYVQLAPANEETERVRQKASKLANTNIQEDEGLIDKIMRIFNK